MKYIFLPLYWLFFLSGFTTVASTGEPVKRVVDLSSTNLGTNHYVLKGEVEFYPNQFLTPANIRNYRGSHKRYAPIPGMWNGFSPDEFTNLSSQGYGTYHWRMLLKNAAGNRYSFKMPVIHSAYNLYVNGEKITSVGVPAKLKSEYSPELFPGIISFDATSDTLDVVMQVSNYHTQSGGILGEIIFGEPKTLRASHNRRIFLDFFLMGALFLAGLYFLNLFAVYRREYWHLWFGILSMFGMLIIATTGEFVLSYLPGVSFEMLLRISSVAFYGLVVFLTLYIWRLFVQEYNKYVAYTAVSAGVLALIISLLGPLSIVQSLTVPALFIVILLIIYKLIVVIQATRKGKRGGFFFLIGFVLLAIAGLHDAVYELSLSVKQPYLGLGLFVFLLMQTYLLNKMIVRTINKNTKLSEELNAANKNLEREVMVRTEKLNDTIKRLTETQKELNRNNKELQRVNETKNKHLSIIGHDLRGPVSGIKTALELIVDDLEEGKVDVDELKDTLKALSANADSAFALLVNLFDWVRNEMNSIEYKPENVNLRELIDETGTLLSQNIQKKGLKLRLIADKNLEAYADRNMLLTILRNLISNAVKFSHSGQIITVEVSPGEKYIEVVVSDEGVGIEEHKLQSIFDYSSTKSTRGTNKEKGTGIGLVLVKEFVDANKGKISVHSEEGKGTSFIFTLPKAKK